MEVAWFHKCLGVCFFVFQTEWAHSENIYDGLDISPFAETYLYLLVKLFLNALFSSEFPYLLEIWSLMDYVDASLEFFCLH